MKSIRTCLAIAAVLLLTIAGPALAACGDGALDVGEQCDDGSALGGDCCSATCQYEPAGDACPDTDGNQCTFTRCDGAGTCIYVNGPLFCDDGLYCNGADMCEDGACSIHAGSPCTNQCMTECRESDDTCQASPEGDPCSDDTACTIDACDGSGSCAHEETGLTSVCRWAVITGEGKVTAQPSFIDAAGIEVAGGLCTDVVKSDGLLLGGSASWVLMTDKKVAMMVFGGGADVASGDVVTKGACLVSKTLNGLFGTSEKEICGCQRIPLFGEGEINTCNESERLTQCADSRAAQASDVATLDNLVSTATLGRFKCEENTVCTIHALDPVSVIDLDSLTLDLGSRLVIDAGGNPDVTVVLRVAGLIKLGTDTEIELASGALPSNTLLYSAGGNCLTGVDVRGRGTLYCPSGKVRLGAHSTWAGSIAAKSKVDIRFAAMVSYEPFLRTLE